MRHILRNGESYTMIDRPVDARLHVYAARKAMEKLRNIKFKVDVLIHLASFYIRNHKNMAKIIQETEQKMHDAKFGQQIELYQYWKGYVDGLKFIIE